MAKNLKTALKREIHLILRGVLREFKKIIGLR
jgi:hypothetical protein